jgi:RNA 2',3'-cyclic 3'-phosphodiesterase
MTDPTDQVTNPPQSLDRIRAFFALVPDDGVRLQFLALAREVARRSRGRSISGEHVHLTLAFLGDVPVESLATIRAIGDAMPRTGASLAFDTLGAWRASGVAWVAPSVLPPALSTLHAKLHAALTEAGFVLENRPFRPHVTLARRCVQPHPRQQSAPIQWSVRKLSLIGSELRPDGPVHRTLADWTLGVA